MRIFVKKSIIEFITAKDNQAKIILILVAVLFIATDSFAWGKIGHDAITYTAECNLTPKAKKSIEQYLHHSIVYYSSWMDDYRATPEYKQTTYWHMAAVYKELQYTDAVKSPNGDVICELEKAIEILKNYRNLDDSTVAVNIKYVIHMVADMHCPSHIYYPGINTGYYITLKDKRCKYHSVWDTQVNELTHRWYYTEWQQQLDRLSKKEQTEITKGTPREWFHQNAVNCKVIYEWAPANSNQNIDFLNKASKLSELQMIKAAYRLASILNQLFD